MGGIDYFGLSSQKVEKIDMTGNFLTEMSGVKNILVGNGFGLSHPRLGDAFKWDMHQAFCSNLASVLPEKTSKSLESDLSLIRISLLRMILKYYVARLYLEIGLEGENNLNHLLNEYYGKIRSKYTCEKFLSGRERILTLNCDPILYFEILSRQKDFLDGFITKHIDQRDRCFQESYHGISVDEFLENGEIKFLKKEFVKCKIERDISERAKIYHLHGAWFILANEDDEIRKLSFSESKREAVESLFQEGQRPFVVIEDRWRVKRTLTEDDVYLNFCHEQLKNIDSDLLIFGCSMEKDDFILDALRTNSKLKKIYVTFTNSDNYDVLSKKFSEDKIGNKTIVFVMIGESEIWEDVKPMKSVLTQV